MSLAEKYTQIRKDYIETGYRAMTVDCIDQKTGQLVEPFHSDMLKTGSFAICFREDVCDNFPFRERVVDFWDEHGFETDEIEDKIVISVPVE